MSILCGRYCLNRLLEGRKTGGERPVNIQCFKAVNDDGQRYQLDLAITLPTVRGVPLRCNRADWFDCMKPEAI